MHTNPPTHALTEAILPALCGPCSLKLLLHPRAHQFKPFALTAAPRQTLMTQTTYIKSTTTGRVNTLIKNVFLHVMGAGLGIFSI